jgi:hypothetical protein
MLTITAVANYTGFINLEGRTNDSGAVLQVYDSAIKATATQLAGAVSAAGGGYTTSHLPGQVLVLGQPYYLLIDRPLYLPTTIMATDAGLIPPQAPPPNWANEFLLGTRPLTPLPLVVLLGGDAVSDDLIDILDAGCIGSAYAPLVYGAITTCGGLGSSDVNGDGYTDIYDLTLMGGNFTRNQSPWTP